MGRNQCSRDLLLLFSSSSLGFLLCFFISFTSAADAYQNYTVGDNLGWFDNKHNPKINYQRWVAGKNFSLGDFLIFNTDKNHSVIQTYNLITYKRCDYNNANANDTVVWSAGQPVVAVPLLKEGMTYFFSGNYDGKQCKHGQHFKIKVLHGLGLPRPSRPSMPRRRPKPVPVPLVAAGTSRYPIR
ncbi:hypothetical protein QJS10_CPB04g00472 [Acorus calamus]|uniref:Phytocyanin domain-containing protein n=1 Tax=Acorus calamus TaxID=4465 RepID=A0AAV9F566_ACOCL|nr:hypothetical protein QJS10_CPB04g00472 [Acorus calamus]